jgi:2-polyprenyl-6-methoxyphenol hydroxylase-like FAD-dependent oxidoreductase
MSLIDRIPTIHKEQKLSLYKMPGFQPRIAITGGGPSGLALGLLLSRRGIHTTIYELRSKPTPEELKKPSGMLDLHEESGLTVMRECGLLDEFHAAVGDCSESSRVLNPEGTMLHTDEGELSFRPEVPRNAITSLLLKSLPEDIIKWNHKITAVRSTRNATTGADEVTLEFGGNGTATYDFVIGADGAWSRVRTLLSDVKPSYTGAQFVTATVTHASTNYPHLVELNGSGTLQALGGGNAILTHRGPQDSIRVYAAVSTPHEHWAADTGLKGKTAAEVKETLLGDDKLFGKWAPQLQDLLATVCDEETKDNPGREADILPLYILPIGHRWESQTTATLIGDAAHLMTPFAGEGVNLALWDSLDLAHALSSIPEATNAAEWQSLWKPRLLEFEEQMQTRAQEKAEESDRNKNLMLGESGAQGLVDIFSMYAEMGAAGGPPEEK